jgi:membrane protein YdbS with pleckstrin-like domain
MNKRIKEICKTLPLLIVFLIATIFSVTFLATGSFSNWVEYQIVITIMVTLIFITGFFFFTIFHYVIRN